MENPYEGLALYQEHGCQGILGLGGGSAMDAAKAVSMMVTNGGVSEKYVGVNKVPKKGAPLILAPTIAGSGSEVGMFSIMLVNGDFGTGVAVAGAFGLIRFRSAPGTAKEIAAIFTAMGVGLACGVGYIGYAAAFAAIMCGAMLLYGCIGLGSDRNEERVKKLTITIPENLDYSRVFDDLFDKYTVSHKLVNVKTTNMGSLFKLSYDVELKGDASEKGFIDELRCRNGNLEINLHRRETTTGEL